MNGAIGTTLLSIDTSLSRHPAAATAWERRLSAALLLLHEHVEEHVGVDAPVSAPAAVRVAVACVGVVHVLHLHARVVALLLLRVAQDLVRLAWRGERDRSVEDRQMTNDSNDNVRLPYPARNTEHISEQITALTDALEHGLGLLLLLLRLAALLVRVELERALAVGRFDLR